MAAIIDVEQLAALRRKAVVLCASVFGDIPEKGIPGSYLADLEADFSQDDAPLPHTVPDDPRKVFEAYGISTDTPVVVYDDQDNHAAPRVWYLGRIAGLKNIAVLDGGLQAWRDSGRETAPLSTPADEDLTRGTIDAPLSWERLADADGVKEALNTYNAHVLDLRSPGRFAGTEPEPRPGMRPGHIPGSKNLPTDLLMSQGGYFKDFDELRDLFEDYVGPAGAITLSCGSAVQAATGALAATVAGYGDVQVYEGSWSEWGNKANDVTVFPVETGGADKEPS